jgi:hypothetical protein
MSFSPPDRPNPFADSAPNPYASPSFQASSMPGQLVPFTRAEARLRLLGPAIGLALFSVLWLVYWAFVAFTNVVDSWRLANAQNTAQAVGILVGMGIAVALFTISPLITLAGAVQMIRVKTYGLCWAAAILGVLPCTLFCFFFTLPFGIWGMVVLYDARVKMAFAGGTNPFGAR